MRSPAPIANSISVVAGTSEMMRRGTVFAAGGPEGPHYFADVVRAFRLAVVGSAVATIATTIATRFRIVEAAAIKTPVLR